MNPDLVVWCVYTAVSVIFFVTMGQRYLTFVHHKDRLSLPYNIIGALAQPLIIIQLILGYPAAELEGAIPLLYSVSIAALFVTMILYVIMNRASGPKTENTDG